MVSEWHPTKNGERDLSKVSVWSHETVWWKCSAGPDHEWQAQIKGRYDRHSSCPFCAKKFPSVTNSLRTKNPELIGEWADDRLTPDQVMPGTQIKVRWRCSLGHEWTALVMNRAIHGAGCPYCSGHKVAGENSLASKFPELAKEWNVEKNGQLAPSDVSHKSAKSVWWKCSVCEHEWRCKPSYRTLYSKPCPRCSNPNRHIRTKYGRHLEQRLSDYKRASLRRGFEWSLSDDEARELLISDCRYCGLSCDPYVKSNGIDRIDSDIGYVVGNVISCCKRCNLSKNNITQKEFFEWIDRIARHQGYVKTTTMSSQGAI